ncbi:MAG: cytochrome c [Phreatobacter sp.]|uniref:c-type cytochrome n=1 Tax=Phreatobacter sp. TaxID=1966341 RepID=UPI002735254F|nr:cytochrome c [Phreatobacter sp.]MDP2803995.1 cytochrome c [Phreatobacter sp.]
MSSTSRSHAGRPLALAAGLAACLAVLPAPAAAANVQRGQTLARTYCATCHAIDRTSPSPLTIAPPFRDLHRSYAVENLSEALAEGIMTGHPSMPQFRFDPDQIEDFIGFLKSLEPRR